MFCVIGSCEAATSTRLLHLVWFVKSVKTTNECIIESTGGETYKF